MTPQYTHTDLLQALAEAAQQPRFQALLNGLSTHVSKSIDAAEAACAAGADPGVVVAEIFYGLGIVTRMAAMLTSRDTEADQQRSIERGLAILRMGLKQQIELVQVDSRDNQGVLLAIRPVDRPVH